ncbi:hypothetical protein QQF64_026997 [Cirrhinus molitorella]|uniref:Uncharacterized protein n=1 Tax=Cirrhinus molitorella TaxID=172907 RepID=A0ABR3NB58_9TELE
MTFPLFPSLINATPHASIVRTFRSMDSAPDSHCTVHEAYPPSLTARSSIDVLESVQTVHLRVSAGAQPLVQEIYFSCVPQTNELESGLLLLILLEVCVEFRFPHDSF